MDLIHYFLIIWALVFVYCLIVYLFNRYREAKEHRQGRILEERRVKQRRELVAHVLKQLTAEEAVALLRKYNR